VIDGKRIMDDIRDERRLTRLLLLLAFCNGTARTFLRAVAYALFLATFSAQGLPYVYVAVSLLGALVSFAYLRFARKVALSRMLPATLAGILATLLLLRAGLGLDLGPWLIFCLPVVYELLLMMTNLSLWTTVGRLLNVQQVKRLSGTISSGEPAAAVAFGLLTAPLVALVGTANLILLTAVAMGAALAVAVVLAREYGGRLGRPSDEPAATATQTPAGEGGRGRYVPLIGAMICMALASYYVIDTIYYAQSQLRFPDPAELAGFIGVFNAVVAVVWTLTNAVVVGRLLRRYGLGGPLLGAPAMLLTGAVGLIGAGLAGAGVAVLFGLAVLNKLLSKLAYDAFLKVSLNIIYQPLPAAQRVRVQTLIEGLVYTLAIGGTGLLLVGLTALLGLDTLTLGVALVVVLAGWLAIGLLLLREYPRQLLRALNRRLLGGGADLALGDPASQAVLRRALRDPQPGAALYALQLLGEQDDPELDGLLPDLLDHPVPAVRAEALLVIERRGARGALPAIRALLAAEANPAVRGAAARALAALGGPPADAEVAALLDSAERPLRLGAAVGLLRGGGEGARAAVAKLARWAASADPLDRAMAAEAIGAAGDGHAAALAPLLDDPDLAVRRAALSAAGQTHSPELWPAVCAALAAPATARAAANALSAGGPAALPATAAAFAAGDSALRQRIAQVWGRVGGEPAIGLLTAQLDSPDPALRGAVQHALLRSGHRPPPAEQAVLVRRVHAEADSVAWALAALADCGAAGESLLAQALLAVARAARGRVLTLLSLSGDRELIARARLALASPSAEQRAYALEIVDTQAPAELKPLLVPLLSDLAPAARLQQLAQAAPQRSLGRDERLRELVSGAGGRAGPWLRACALDAAARVGHPALADLASPLRAAADPVLRETAALALARAALTQAAPGGNEVGPGSFGAVVENGGGMLSRIERVLILKTVALFGETPDEVLADIAGLLHETEVLAGTPIFSKGEAGTSMYVIVEGEVRVHDGDHTLNHLQTRDVFGEMALLDPEPRVASVTAVRDTWLLRLDQEPFYELMDERHEVARGVIRVITRHLRARVRDLGEVRARLAQAVPADPAGTAA